VGKPAVPDHEPRPHRPMPVRGPRRPTISTMYCGCGDPQARPARWLRRGRGMGFLCVTAHLGSSSGRAGHLLRNTTEHLLLPHATRPVKFSRRPHRDQRPVQTQPQAGSSSPSSSEFGLALLELFARRRPQSLRLERVGQPIDSDIQIPGYPVPSATEGRCTSMTGGRSSCRRSKSRLERGLPR